MRHLIPVSYNVMFFKGDKCCCLFYTANCEVRSDEDVISIYKDAKIARQKCKKNVVN